MRLSILATTLAVLALPASAVPHKIGRCVAKKALPSSSASGSLVESSSASSEASASALQSASAESSVSTSASASAEPSASASADASSSWHESSSNSASTSASSSDGPAPSSSQDSSSASSEPSSTSDATASPSATASEAPQPSTQSGPLVAPEDKADGSSQPFRDQILQLHNDVRSQFSSPPLYWDQKLADSAAAWVDQCNFSSSGTPYTSENIAAGQGSNLLPYLFQQWAQEKDNYDMANPGLTGFRNGVTGHFTQIVWKGTTSLGCAWKACPAGKIQPGWTNTATYLVCQYSPPGNYAPGGDGTKQSFCDNVGCNDDVRSSLPQIDAVQGFTIE